MHYTHSHIPRPFSVPFGPWLVPILGILLCTLLLITTSKGTAARFGIWMGIGHIVYFSYGFWHSRTHSSEQQNLENPMDEMNNVEVLFNPVFELKDEIPMNNMNNSEASNNPVFESKNETME